MRANDLLEHWAWSLKSGGSLRGRAVIGLDVSKAARSAHRLSVLLRHLSEEERQGRPRLLRNLPKRAAELVEHELESDDWWRG